MNDKKATLIQGALIVGAFVALALVISALVESQLPDTADHGSSHGVSALLTVDVVRAPTTPLDMMKLTPVAGVKERSLQGFYALRAYPGAPPMIPHPVDDDGVIADSCNSCHEDGGYAPEYNAYSPRSPHPEKANCRQCHVPAIAKELFVQTAWLFPEPPKLGRAALPGSPPPVPHTLHLRENCQACHVGPGAVREIRVSHPERENCEQCHVPEQTHAHFITSYPIGSATDATK